MMIRLAKIKLSKFTKNNEKQKLSERINFITINK